MPARCPLCVRSMSALCPRQQVLVAVLHAVARIEQHPHHPIARLRRPSQRRCLRARRARCRRRRGGLALQDAAARLGLLLQRLPGSMPKWRLAFRSARRHVSVTVGLSVGVLECQWAFHSAGWRSRGCSIVGFSGYGFGALGFGLWGKEAPLGRARAARRRAGERRADTERTTERTQSGHRARCRRAQSGMGDSGPEKKCGVRKGRRGVNVGRGGQNAPRRQIWGRRGG